MSYPVHHLKGGTLHERPYILLNGHQSTCDWSQDIDPAIEEFHKTLPDYGETALHSLPNVAAELGFSHVFIKDESTRFGLPSFKILGASWAVHQTICKKLRLPKATSLQDLAKALERRDDIRLVTTTDGNWGRALARMAKYLSIPITVYVPGFMPEYTRNLIRGEGADLQVLEGASYDECIAEVQIDAATSKALMVMDTSWEDYTEIPQWVTDGYSTMLRETDRQVRAQTDGLSASLALVSVGVGSWAQAVVSHYKSKSSSNKILSVEPDTAASFKESLHCDAITPIETGDTIMNGMNCGTTSTIAWPVMKKGVHAAVAVTDIESHEAVQYLQSEGVNAGPCGAATLAALRKMCDPESGQGLDLEERAGMVVVLFSTEGMREYPVPT